MKQTHESRRIVLVLDTKSGAYGGTEANAIEFARWLALSGEMPILVQVGKRVVDALAEKYDISLRTIETDDLQSVGFGTWLRLLRDSSADVLVQVKGWVGSRSARLDAAAALLRCPRVVWENHPAPKSSHGYWGKPLGARWIKRRLAASLHYDFASRVVAISEAVKLPLLTEFRLTSKRVQVIYPGVDFKVFSRDEKARAATRKVWGVNGSQVVIGAMGRLVEFKGYGFVIQLVAAIRNKVSRDIACVIAGEGPDRVRLEQLARDLGVDDLVKLPGWVESASAAWSSIDISLLPSNNEGLGLALIEAAASGSIPVAADCEGMREVMYDRTSTFRLPVSELDQWGKLLVQLVSLSDDERALLNSTFIEEFVIRFDANRQWAALWRAALGRERD